MIERSLGQGKWYLTYTEFDSMENELGDAVVQHKIDIDVKPDLESEAEAVIKGEELWSTRIAKGTYKGWDSKVYPHTPKVIYEIPLKGGKDSRPQNSQV